MENKEYVLFSNVGLTDPIKDNHDGPLLHIIRKYRPKKIYLFFTDEVKELDDADNRYVETIRSLDPDVEIIKYKDDKIERPDDFSAFDKIYSDKITEIIEENPNLNLLINMGSGTAQMKSSLYYMVADAKVNCKLVQVPTHNQSSNTPKYVRDNYNIIGEIEQNQDNCENYEDRCREIRPDNIRKKIIKSMIKQYIDVYNYEGAYIAALEAGDLIDEEVHILIKFLKHRIKLEFSELDKFDYKKLLIQDKKVKTSFEYILTLQIKQKNNELIDFIRGISPILTDLFEEVLRQRYKVNIRDYCKENESKVLCVDKYLLPKDVKENYDKYFNKPYKSSPLCSTNILPYIEYMCDMCGKDEQLFYKKLNKLRKFEAKYRNKAAHEIISITDEDLKKDKKIGLDSKDVIDIIKDLFEKTYQDKYEQQIKWDSYDEFNQEILNYLDK